MNKGKNSKKIRNVLYEYCSQEWHSIIQNSETAFSVNKGGKIFAEGDPVKGVYFIDSGIVKVVSGHTKKIERILRLAGNGELLGHRGFSVSNYPVSAIALTNTKITFVPRDIFRTLIKTNSTLSLYLIDFLSNELRESEERTESLMHSEIKDRIVVILLKLADLFGYDKQEPQKLFYSLSRTDLANMAGTTYETVIRILASLQKQKYIKLTGKSIHLLKPEKLRTLL